jgi:hypothetical protein
VAVLPSSIDYTDKDFDALRARLVALVGSVFPEWSDFSVASFGTVLLEMYAFVGDVLGFYLDGQARESRLSTATQRRNVIALARMLGYRLHGAQAATAVLSFRLGKPPAADVVLPAGAVIRTQEVTEPVRFQLLADVTIPAGASPPVATGLAEHSKTRTQLFDSAGLAFLDVVLDFTPYLDGSVTVTAGNGAFTEVDSLLGSGPNDLHFMVLVDQNDRATLRFGSGSSGAPPTGTLSVTYKTGGGAAGNVDAGRLVVLDGTFADAFGKAVQISVTNDAPAGGGAERETIASAQLLAPASLRALTRTVAREDFEIHAREVPGVARALMLTSNEDPGIEENTGILYVIPTGGGLPTPALKNKVLRQVTEVYPCTLTFLVSVQAPLYRRIDVEARVYPVSSDPKSRIAVRERVKANLAAMFALNLPDSTPNPAIDFGFNMKGEDGVPAAEIAWSDVFDVIRDTVGVRKVGAHQGDLKLCGLPADVRLRVAEFPVLGQVTLLDGDAGGVL